MSPECRDGLRAGFRELRHAVVEIWYWSTPDVPLLALWPLTTKSSRVPDPQDGLVSVG